MVIPFYIIFILITVLNNLIIDRFRESCTLLIFLNIFNNA